MLVTERHIQYLEWVEQGRITVRNSRYVSTNWATGYIEVDHLVALHSEAMGLTHIIFKEDKPLVSLTARGLAFLTDEREAWG